jgi:hypothetical protein
MTSPKRKRSRLEESRFLRAKAVAGVDATDMHAAIPADAVVADLAQLAHNNTYGALPRFYLDRIIQCRQCGTEEVWPAARQKWWYEVAKGNIFTQAVLCRACRAKGKARKAAARQVHLDGLARKRARTET